MLTITERNWTPFGVKSGLVSNVEPLFERISTARIEEELEQLNNQTISK